MRTKAEVLEVTEADKTIEMIRQLKGADNRTDEERNAEIPYPFKRGTKGGLFLIGKEKADGTQDTKLVCRDLPVIIRKLMHVERSEVFYELYWRADGREQREIIPALSISTRSEIIKLADRNLAVNDGNVKELIRYFDLFQSINHIPTAYAVDRLGLVKGHFIHPLLTDDVEIMPPDLGEKQALEAFAVKGTSSQWMENIFNKVREHPKALTVTLASFTSVILHDLNLSPSIVDMSGSTSRGKTTALRVAATVWGKPDGLVNEWNATRVSIERKNAWLNSFPALYDDTMKANPKQLQDVIYNFSGGKSKGRGSVKGSQIEYTWRSMMISTGENSLLEYAEAGGAAARVLPLTGLPFGEEADHIYFRSLYDALGEYYGQIGIDFLKQWKARKSELIGLYHGYKNQFQTLAGENQVLARVALHYGAIVFTAHLLNEFFNAEINLDLFTDLYKEIKRENKAIDKPLQRLEQVLSELDRDRAAIYYEDDARPNIPIAALYNKGVLYLMPDYLEKKLGPEVRAIREEWRRRGITSTFERNGKEVDYIQKWHVDKNIRSIPINQETIKEMGFDFSRKSKTW